MKQNSSGGLPLICRNKSKVERTIDGEYVSINLNIWSWQYVYLRIYQMP